MKAAGLWDCVTGTASWERTDADATSMEQKSFYLVLQCMGQKYVPMVMTLTTKELWDSVLKGKPSATRYTP